MLCYLATCSGRRQQSFPFPFSSIIAGEVWAMAPQAAAKHQSSNTLFNFRICSSSWVCMYVFFLLSFSSIAASRHIIKTLPGFSGDLPFKLETGYVGVGDTDEVQLFYYFVESQRSPTLDPLMLWLTGGPGCSCLSAFFYESGPLQFKYVDYNGSLPTLMLNEYAWTKGLNIIYVDAPVGTGFSYSETSAGYYSDDYQSSAQTYQFLRKWLIDHPQYMTNQLYVGGDSYSGIPLPMIVTEIYNGNQAQKWPYMNLKGYMLGNPVTDSNIDGNAKIPFANRMTLVPDDLYEHAKTSCYGDFVNVNPSNAMCMSDLQAITELLRDINLLQILEPNCNTALPKPNEKDGDGRRSIEEYSNEFILSQSPALWCRDYNYVLSGVWANDLGVREALHVRNGTKGNWARCNSSLAYTKVVTSSVPYHKNLTSTNLRALVYSGDHDMSIPHLGTQKWINSLNMTLDDTWRAWFVDAQVAGYTEKFIDSDFSMVYATVKGAGHVAPEFKPKECYFMIDRWFANYPL